MRHRTEVAIDAAAAEVWQILHDVTGWQLWSPTIDRITVLSGAAGAVGSRSRVEQPKMRPMIWTIEGSEPGRSFNWSTGGTGWHMVAGHEIAAVGDGRTQATLTIDLTGPLAGLLTLMAGRRIREYVDLEAASLARASEAAATR